MSGIIDQDRANQLAAAVRSGDLKAAGDLFNFLSDRAYGNALLVKDRGVVGGGDVDDITAINEAIEYADANDIGTVVFPLDRYSISEPILLRSNIKYVFESYPFVNFVRATSDINILKSHPDETFLSKVTIDGLHCYPNVENTAACINASNFSICTMKNLFFFKGGLAFDFDGACSDINIEKAFIEHFNAIQTADGGPGIFYTRSTFIEDFAGTGQGLAETVYDASGATRPSTQYLGLTFDRCIFEKYDLNIDTAVASVRDCHLANSSLWLGPHSANCIVEGPTGDISTRSIIDLGWNNSLNGIGGNNVGPTMSRLINKAPELVPNSSNQIPVTALSEYLFMSSMTADTEDAIDTQAFEYYDVDNTTVLYTTNPANIYGLGPINQEWFKGRREFNRFTNIHHTIAPSGASAIEVRGVTDSTNTPIDTFAWENLLTNGDLKSNDKSASSVTGWTTANLAHALTDNEFVTLTGTNSWRCYQQVSSLTPGGLYAVYARHRDSTNATQIFAQNARFAVTSGNGRAAEALQNTQEKWLEKDGGYIAVAYFTATYDSYFINITNFQSSIIDINWIALVKLA